MVSRFLILSVIACLLCVPVRAAEKVDLELVLLADASGSIDEAETRFQREGYAAAFAHRDVLSAIASGFHRRIAVTFVEWGDEHNIDVVVPWTMVSDLASAKALGDALRLQPKKAWGRNAIGAAIAKGHSLIESNDIQGVRKVIDFSGDSANSWSGPPVSEARAAALAAGIVINGLAIACRDIGCGRSVGYDLERAFARTIIGGPGSFVVTADSKTSFGEAVRRKLVLEIAGITPVQTKRYAGNRDLR
ncbi:MAG: hypothetical protein RLZ98_3501 [Pseudomonadota bacterium]|jgi:hypothetical protein